MKKLMKLMMGIAVAAISFTGCENNFDGANVENKGFELTVVTDATRTEYDATLQDVKWSAGDKAKVIVKGLAENITATIDGSDSRIASFVYANSKLAEGTVKLQGFAPTATVNMEYDATEASGNRTCATRYGINLPATQDTNTATFDKDADILVADDMEITVSAADVTAGKKTVGNFHFRRMVAITEFTYNVTNSELTASDEKVESVSFEVVSEGKYLAGNMYIQPNMDGAKYVKSDLTEITDLKNIFYGSTSNKVTVNLSDKPAVKNGFKAWFVTAPVTLEAADKLVFTVVTDKGTTITKTVEAVGKEVSFLTTQKNTLTVNLNNAVEIEKVEVGGGAWQKVTSALADYSGKYLIVYETGKVAFNGGNVQDAVGNTISVVINDGVIATSAAMEAAAFIIEPSTTSGKYYVKGTDGKYIGHGSYANALTAGTTKYNHTISIDASGNANLVVSTSGGDITLKFNSASDQVRFRYYKSGQQSVALYRFVEEGGSIPVTPVLAVNAQPATVAAEGANVTVALTAANLTEAVTATPSASWITNATVNDNNNLTFTVAANDVEQERTATITLKSGDLTATVNVKQEAKAAENPGGGDVVLSVAHTFTASGLGSDGYKAKTGKSTSNGVSFTVTCGNDIYVGSNSSKKANCVLGSSYAKVGTPCGYDASTTYVVAVISESKMSNIGKVVAYNNGDSDSTAPTKISLVYSTDGSTYTLVETQTYSKSGNTWEFDVKESAYYAVVMQRTSYIRTKSLKIDFYSAN